MKEKLLILFTVVGLSSGCANDCQQLCVDIRAFAKDCGEPFTDEDFQECMKEQGKKNGDERRSCTLARETPIEEQWTCEDIEVYFN